MPKPDEQALFHLVYCAQNCYTHSRGKTKLRSGCLQAGKRGIGMDAKGLDRFYSAQEKSYATALSEVKNGRKRSHWMWYIFPQIQGLGFSSISQYYSIRDLEEAEAYLNDPVLGERLKEISQALLDLDTSDPYEVFGSPDDMKLRSSMTLFAILPDADPVFQKVLDKFYGGKKDKLTLRKVGKE